MRRDRGKTKRLLELVREEPGIRHEAQELLRPLAAYDAEHGGDLARTLRVLFEHNGNVSRAAEALFLHRNGLLYRLSRIEALLGVSLADPASRLALELALTATEA